MRGKKIKGLALVVLIIFLGILVIKPTVLRSQSVPEYKTLEHYLPDNTFALLTLPDLKKARADFEKSNLNKIWQEEEVQQFWKSVKPQVDPLIKQLEDQMGITLNDILGFFNNELSIALFHNSQNRDLYLAIVLDIGDKKQQLDALVTKLIPGGDKESYKYKNIEIRSLGALHYAYLDTKFLLSPQREAVELIITNYQALPQAPLTDSALFKKAKIKVSPDNSAMLFYLNLEQILSAFGADIPGEVKGFLEGIGLDSIKFIAASLSFHDNGLIKEKIYIDTPTDQRRGLTKLFTEAKPCELWLDQIPQNVLSYSAIHLEPVQAWTEILTIIKSLPLPISESPGEMIGTLEQKLGFSIKDDFLASLGDNFVAYSMFPEAGGILPDQVTIAKLNDKEKFESCADKFAIATESPLKEIPFKNYLIKGSFNAAKLMVLAGESDPSFMRSSFPGFGVAGGFYYFINNDYLYLSENAHSLKRVILRIQKKMPTLATDPKFKDLPASNSQVVFYLDVEQGFNLVYNSLVPLAQFAVQIMAQIPFLFDSPGAQMGLEMVNDILPRLPLGETIGQHLSSVYSTVKADKEGMTIDSSSSFGFTPMTIGGTAIIAAIAIPNLLSSRKMANEVSAVSGLRTLMAVEATWSQQDADRNGTKDYWTYDISCLNRIFRADNATKVSMIDIAFAKADAKPADFSGGNKPFGTWPMIEDWSTVGLKTMPKSGYYFKAMVLNENGQPYNSNTVGSNNVAATNSDQFAFVAYPAEYGVSGRRTFIVNQNGTVYAKDLGPDFGVRPEAPPLKLTPELEKEIQSLIQELGVDSPDIREKATDRLAEIGKPSLKYLNGVVEHKDAEVKFRAKLIIKQVTQPKLLPIDQWPALDPTTEGWGAADF